MKTKFRYLSVINLIAFLVASFGLTVNAAPKTSEYQSPYKVLATTGQGLFARIANNQQELERFPDLMRTIVEEELMPHVDYKYAAFKILGKQLKRTTKEQRAKFADSMRQYLIRTYATALKQYNNQQVVYQKPQPYKGKKIVSVDTKIVDLVDLMSPSALKCVKIERPVNGKHLIWWLKVFRYCKVNKLSLADVFSNKV